MTNHLFSNLSRAAQEQLLVQEEILQGAFGEPGSPFMTTRALAELRQVSVVTAHKILLGLCYAGYVELRGKSYYLSHARIMEERNSQTNIIGMMVPKLNNEFFSSLSEAVVHIARQAGYRVLVVATSYAAKEEVKTLQLLQSLSVAGIISCIPTVRENENFYLSNTVPCVFLGHALDKCRNSSVQVNSFSIAQKVARHLTEEGYRHFLYFGSANKPLEKDIRFTGFQMELNQEGYHLDAEDILQVTMDSKADDHRIAKILQKQDEPVGVFCYHDLIAVRIYSLCHALGKRIPEDVGVVGFDDLSIAQSLTPALTTVQYSINTMADMTFKLLLAAIQSPKAPHDNYYVEPNLVIRGSSVLSNKKDRL